jgi:hypothetical protein
VLIIACDRIKSARSHRSSSPASPALHLFIVNYRKSSKLRQNRIFNLFDWKHPANLRNPTLIQVTTPNLQPQFSYISFFITRYPKKSFITAPQMNFFKSKQRTPPDLVRSLRDVISKLDVGPPESRRKVCFGRFELLSMCSCITPIILNYSGGRGSIKELGADQVNLVRRWRPST